VRLLWLYCKSRRATMAVLTTALATVIGIVWGNWQPRPGSAIALVALSDHTPITVFVPLIAACVIGASVVNPHSTLELAGDCPLRVLRFAHVGILIAIAFCLCLGLAMSLPGLTSNWVILRNFSGFTAYPESGWLW